MNTKENFSTDIPCTEALARIEQGTGEAEDSALAAHLARCADCRAEAHLRTLTAQLYADVPAGLNDAIMRQIRTERARTLAHRRWIRRFSAVAAALVLVPAVVIVAPILLDSANTSTLTLEDIGDSETRRPVYTDAKSESAPETIPSDTVEETETALVTEELFAANGALFGSTLHAEPSEAEADRETSAEDKMAVKNDADNAQDTLPSAPSYVGAKGESETTSKKVTTMSTFAAAGQSENTLFRVLRALVGDTEFDDYAEIYEGDDRALAIALCRDFQLSRTDLETQAAHMGVALSVIDLNVIFGE